ncbi:unnamed protein product, partial [Medioppia subpectinata]
MMWCLDSTDDIHHITEDLIPRVRDYETMSATETTVTAGAEEEEGVSAATNGLTLTIKWSSQEYAIDSVTTDDTVRDLKEAIYRKTGVKPERQKLMGLKANGKPVTDATELSKV